MEFLRIDGTSHHKDRALIPANKEKVCLKNWYAAINGKRHPKYNKICSVYWAYAARIQQLDASVCTI